MMFVKIERNAMDRKTTSELLNVENITREQLDAELQKGVDSIKAGNVYTADEVESILNQQYGL